MMKAIELNKITVSHNHVEVLKGLDLVVRMGQITGIIGAQRSGKTTLLQLLSGNRMPASGTGTILGRDIYSLRPNAHKAAIGYVPASLGLDNELTVGETLQVFSYLYNGNSQHEDLVKNILRQIDLEYCTEVTVGRLPLRQQLLLAISISLLHSPQILLIDEPAPYLEENGRLDFFRLMREIANQGIAVIIATRSVPDGSYCDEVAILHKGRLSMTGSVDRLCEAFDVTCFEAHNADRLDETLMGILKHAGLVAYLSGRTLRVVNPVGWETELQQYGFYKISPGLEDVKRLYESVVD